MSEAVLEQEKRSQQLADTLRKFLGVINTGGITAMLATAGALANHNVNPGWTLWPLLSFAVGIALVGASMFTGQHRAIARRKEAQSLAGGLEQMGVDMVRGALLRLRFRWYWHSWPYNIGALLAFISGAVVAIVNLSHVVLHSTGGSTTHNWI